MNPKVSYPQTRLAHWRGRIRINLLAWSVALLASSAGLARAQDKYIAYVIPAGTVGNQAFSGTLGMEFDVANAIIITQLGVFDDGSDGLLLPITARLYDRATDPPTELASLEFSPDAPGTLIGGSRFKPLTTPLTLAAGFQGTIVAEGYGAEERLRNAGVGAAGVSWTLDNGKGSIQFVGSARYGTSPGEYPGTPDGGPAERYAAGTFEFQTTPAELPGKPVISLKPGDKQITISWPAVTQPAPAAMYRVSRRSDPAGPFSQIAEIPDTTYVDQALANGTLYCYTVKAVTAAAKTGPDSEAKCAFPYPALPANQQIAYFVPAGVEGNQNYGGSLGMEFDVQNPIIVQKLGVFDDSTDGLQLPITARTFNRADQTIVAEIAFTPEDAGTPIEGMRFKALTQPLRLEAGFKGLIEADGYGDEERNYNTFMPTTDTPWSLNDGNGSVQFVGPSFYGNAGEYPLSADGGPAARYGAGSFQYEITAPQKPGSPQLTVLLPPEDASATLQWNPVLNPLPAAKYQVVRATSVDGPFTQVAEVTTTTYHDTGLANGTQVFYKVRGIAAGGETGLDSNVVAVTPNPRGPGVAYVNPANTDGNQAYGGSLGLDFDVARSIQITKLGVWDEASDGLNLTLTAAVYDRQTRKALVTLEFTTDSPGDLVGGSRFKTLPQPLVLAAGFQGTMVAYGYGDGERNFNRGIGVDDPTLFQTFDGASLIFVGGSRYGNAGEFPANPDGGPAQRYGAGTFYFEPLADLPKLSISVSNGKIKITWTGSGVLESAPDLTGPWAAVPGATSGIEITPTADRQFYRIK